jgi:hypothetical protein
MAPPRPSVVRFTRAVVRAERTRTGGESDADVVARVFARLHQEIGKLIGPDGCDVLLARSLVLAQRAHPALSGVTSGPGGKLAGLDVVAIDEVALHGGSVAIVCQFIELLSVLVGEDLTTRLLGGIWPAAEEEENQ